MAQSYKPMSLGELLGTGPTPTFASVEEEHRYREAASALNAEAETGFDDPTWLREQADVLAESLDFGFQSETAFGRVFNVRKVGENERVFIKERRGLKVFYTHRGGYIEESQIHEDGFELKRDGLGFHVSEFEDKLRADFADSLATLSVLGRRLMEAESFRRMLQLLREAIPPGSPSYVAAAGAALTPAIVNGALSGVMDAPKPTRVDSGRLSIVGRSSALDVISDFPGFGPAQLNQINQQGYLGIYRGAEVIRLENVVDETGASFVPDDEVWVVHGDVGEFVKYGSVRAWGWMEQSVRYLHQQARMEIGGAVTRPLLARRIVLT